MFITWLAAVLRARGLNVIETEGWQTRGKEWPGAVKGVLCHHTAGALHGNAPSLHLVTVGRPDLPGPLSQLVLGRDGTFYVVAAGRSNHAGAGMWQGITAGNSSFIGIEAENAGTPADPWPTVQTEAYAQGVAAILLHIGAGSEMVAGHKEYALPRGRKIDPTFEMNQFRLAVKSAMDGNRLTAVAVDSVHPQHAMLRVGDTGSSVQDLQRALTAKGHAVEVDGGFGANTFAAVKAFQTEHQLEPDGKVGPMTWAALTAQ